MPHLCHNRLTLVLMALSITPRRSPVSLWMRQKTHQRLVASLYETPVGLSTAFPDLTRYGREGGEYQFFTEMPGVNMRDGGIARGPQGEVTGPGGTEG